MMSALRLGRYRFVIAWTVTRVSTIASRRRYGHPNLRRSLIIGFGPARSCGSYIGGVDKAFASVPAGYEELVKLNRRCREPWRSSGLAAGWRRVHVDQQAPTRRVDGAHTDQQGGHLFSGEFGEDFCEHLAPVRRHVAEDLGAGLGLVDEDNPAVIRAVAPFDESALLHPIDYSRGAGVRDVPSLGQAPHR